MKTGKPFLIAGVPIAGLALHSWSHRGAASAWTPPRPHPSRARRPRRAPAPGGPSSPRSPRAATSLPSTLDDVDLETLNLTPELEMMTNAFGSIPDEKTRHKQLLYMASRLPPVDDGIKIPENKVPGCLSTVHVDCAAERAEEGGGLVVNYVGDSDGLLTKGLLALLIRGMSGCTAEQINAVDPKFIQAAKISQTLTPGRNNGFLNMLAVMKKKATEAVEKEASGVVEGSVTSTNGIAEEETAVEEANGDGIVTSFDSIDGKPMYNAILSTLIGLLKPTTIRLEDISSQYADHSDSKGEEESGESHFALEVVAEAFEGLNVVKRQQLVYMLLGEVMPKIQALEITARSPSEV